MSTDNQSYRKRPKNFRLNHMLVALFIGLCVGASIYVLLHLAGKLDSMGQSGSNIAQIWSFIVAILELVTSVGATIIAIYLQNKANKQAQGQEVVTPKMASEERKFRPWYGAIGLGAAVIAFTVPPAVNNYVFHNFSQENITNQITLSKNNDMSDGDTAYAKLPSTEHTQLKITFKLISQESTGSCVGPARLKVTPIFNSNDGRTLTDILSGAEQTITLGDMSGTTKLEIGLQNDPHCKVKLRISSAIYSR